MFDFVKRKVKKSPLLYAFIGTTIFFELVSIVPSAYNLSISHSTGVSETSKFNLELMLQSLSHLSTILSYCIGYFVLHYRLYEQKVKFLKKLLIIFYTIFLTFVLRQFFLWFLTIVWQFSFYYNNPGIFHDYTIYQLSNGLVTESPIIIYITKTFLLFAFLCSIYNSQQVSFLSQKLLSQLRVSSQLNIKEPGVNKEIETIASNALLNQNLNENNDDLFSILYVDKGREKQFIKVEDIFYFKSDGNYLDIFTSDEDYTIRMTLKELQSKLPDYFARVHRSNILNLYNVKALKQDPLKNILKAKMLNDLEVLVSRTYHKSIKDKLALIKKVS